MATNGFGATVIGLTPNAITEAQKEIILNACRHYHGLLCFEFEHLLMADELHALTAIFGYNEFAPGLINGIGKKATIARENISVENQVKALRQKGRDPYLAFIGNVDPNSLKMKKIDKSNYIGEILAKRAKEKNIEKVYFDRGSNKYHGRLKIFAETLRKNGLKF